MRITIDNGMDIPFTSLSSIEAVHADTVDIEGGTSGDALIDANGGIAVSLDLSGMIPGSIL